MNTDKKVYRHYGTNEFDSSRTFSSLSNLANYKPRGMWACPVDCEYGWKEWCEDEDFNVESLDQHFDFVLTEDARILEIHKVIDILPYTKWDGRPGVWSAVQDPTANFILDYDKLKNEFDGMEVFLHEDLVGLHWSKLFYGYDVDSIVLWNLDTVVVIDTEHKEGQAMKIREDAVNGNSYTDTVLVLFSDMNPGDEIYIIPNDHEKLDDIRKVADAAYGEWYAADSEDSDAYYDAIGSYVEAKLREAGFKENKDYLMFFGPGFEAD